MPADVSWNRDNDPRVAAYYAQIPKWVIHGKRYHRYLRETLPAEEFETWRVRDYERLMSLRSWPPRSKIKED